MDIPNKIKILIVVRWPVGGIRTFMRYVFRQFNPEHYHLTILVPGIPEVNVLAKDLEGLDVTVIRLSERPSFLELFLAVTRQLMCGKYDLVHSQGYISGMCSALPSYLLRTPHVLTSHDMLSNEHFKGLSGALKRVALGVTLSLTTKLHSVSNDARKNITQFFPFLDRGDKCVVIKNGIESSRFVDAIARDLRTEFHLPSDVFLIGFLGRFMAPKGFIYLVDAIDQLRKSGPLKQRPLVLAFGEGGFIREEKLVVEERGLQEYFSFLPFETNVAGVIKGLDLVVIPSLWETCPILPMEVLACGTPVVASNCIGLREVVHGTPAYVVPSRDSKALSDMLYTVMKERVTQPFTDFAAKAAAMFDSRNQAESIQRLYGNLIGEGRL